MTVFIPEDIALKVPSLYQKSKIYKNLLSDADLSAKCKLVLRRKIYVTSYLLYPLERGYITSGKTGNYALCYFMCS